MKVNLQTQDLSIQFSLTPEDNGRLANLCGECDEHLRQIEDCVGIEIHNRGHEFEIVGKPKAIEIAKSVITKLYQETSQDPALSPAKIHLFLHGTGMKNHSRNGHHHDKSVTPHLQIQNKICHVLLTVILMKVSIIHLRYASVYKGCAP